MADIPIGRQDVRADTCEEFNTRCRAGYTTTAGETRPGEAGATEYEITPDARWTEVRKNVTIVRCTSTGKVYEDMRECLKKCRLRLGEIHCPPIGTRVRLTARNIRARFALALTVGRFNWVPSKPLSPACQAAKGAWEAAAETHELGHVASIRALVDAGTTEFSPGDVTVEVETYPEAKAALQQAVRARLDGFAATLRTRIDDAAREYHRTHTVPEMDCSACRGPAPPPLAKPPAQRAIRRKEPCSARLGASSLR